MGKIIYRTRVPILEKIADQLTVSEIAVLMGITYNKARYLVTRHNLTTKNNDKRISGDDVEIIMNLHRQGYCAKEICFSSVFSLSTIYRVINQEKKNENAKPNA